MQVSHINLNKQYTVKFSDSTNVTQTEEVQLT